SALPASELPDVMAFEPTTWPATPILVETDPRAAFRQLVEERYGLRLAEHQTRRLDEEIQRLAVLARMPSTVALYEAMASGARGDLLAAMAAALTVGETHFFGVQPQ